MNEDLPYKDRSGGLIFFGILTILLGCVSGLFALVMTSPAIMQSASGAPAQPLWTLIPGIGMYGLLAVALIWLGVGSILARRWARALLLIFSWFWLLVGVTSTIFVLILMPKIFANLPAAGGGSQSMSPATIAVAMTVMMCVCGFVYVVLPLAWLLFYRSRHVKATCDARTPDPVWTDACPLPVLALALLSMISGAFCLLMPLAGHAVLPLFGWFVTGFPAAATLLGVGVIWLYLGWLLYKLQVTGWWLLLIGMLIWSVSAFVTFSHTDLITMFKLMGYPERTITQMQSMNWMNGNFMLWAMGCGMVPWLGFVLFVKRYFNKYPA